MSCPTFIAQSRPFIDNNCATEREIIPNHKMGSVPQSEEPLLAAALREANERYYRDHPHSEKSHHQACKYMPGGNTRTVLYTQPFPLTISHGESCYLTTVDGHKYVDFLGEYTAGIYGHSHPVIKKAIQKAADHGWNYGGHSEVEQTLAQTVCERFPAIDMVRFVNSGTEANMMALATALAYTGKKKILIFRKGYHGSTIAGKISSDKTSINLPHDFMVGTYNDVEGTQALISSLPENSLAAILVEPMMGSGGCFKADKLFLHSLRNIATQQRALLVFDEVMTSRLGYQGYGALCEIIPDLMTLGKWIGGGMSFGAFGGRKDIMQLYDPREGKLEHPGTFNNNVFTMHAGVAGCQLLNKDVIAALNALGEDMRKAVEAVLQKYHIKGKVPSAPLTDELRSEDAADKPPKMFIKGVGSLMTIHFAGPDRNVLQGLFFHHMLNHGIYMAQRGFIALSIEITRAHVTAFVQHVDSFCREWETSLRW